MHQCLSLPIRHGHPPRTLQRRNRPSMALFAPCHLQPQSNSVQTLDRATPSQTPRGGRKTGGMAVFTPRRLSKTFSDYDPFLLDYLGRAWTADPSIMSSLADLQDFSLWRSPQAGTTTEAANHGVPSSTVDMIGRWRKRESARGSEPGLPMRQVYTRVRDSIEGLLIFSRSL